MSQAVGGAVGASKTDLIVVLGIAALVGSLALLASVYLGLLFLHSGGPGLWVSYMLAPSYWFLDWTGVQPPFDAIAMLSGQFVHWSWIVFALRALAVRRRKG